MEGGGGALYLVLRYRPRSISGAVAVNSDCNMAVRDKTSGNCLWGLFVVLSS